MGRQDIVVDARYGEMETTDHLTTKTFHDFRFLDRQEGMDNDTYRYAEITVPYGFERKYRDTSGIHACIPYTPEYKRLMVRFPMQSGSGGTEYMINRRTNKVWFPVYRNRDGKNTEIYLPELVSLNEEGYFNLLLEDGFLCIYSGAETDLRIGTAKSQNEIFLLKAASGNLYQHPSSGVGLIDFLHSNLENNGLAARLQSEFDADGMIVRNAYMDSATGELLLDVVEKEDVNG